ncbi:hypothetical protein EUTSA_v10028969mg [Eutrema salsugineum]|uniref:Uncharacterized protein n=1 Tax=Eutrema salsugineum TaxID=72664 RepID=V4N0Z1_EUTSA|nr:uncharacterized protein LOC18014434 [Eutrema salsugineum]ESQ38701.1 hypothetical protein EUTSA_v10028969mg [Eutrema salsugineum]
MLEFTDKGTSWLMKKRELALSYRMESEEASKKRKCHQLLANDDLVERVEASSFDQKRKRFSEDTANYIDEEYHHNRKSLDLELNLSPSLIDLNNHHDHDHDLSNYNKNYERVERKKKMMEMGSVLGLKTQKSMGCVAFDLDDDGNDSNGGGGEEEMVARVCMKCNMLVMLCKALPACPNCKFMHSPEDTTLSLLFTPKPTLLA